VRTLLERHAVANRENVWNGRPISLIVLAEPLEVLDGWATPSTGSSTPTSPS
jgi:predicted metalloenzyme YecM